MSAPTRDEVIRMAREAGAPDPMVFLAAYERLVAAAYARGVSDEMEACANVCDGVYHQNIGPQYGEVRHGISACAAAIRARSQP